MEQVSRKKRHCFFFFTTNCGSCEIGAQEICNFGKQNPNVNLVFITENQNIEEVKKFIKNNKIYEVTKNIFIDYNRNFREDFGLGISISIPTILYYDENGKYLKEIKDFDELPLI